MTTSETALPPAEIIEYAQWLGMDTDTEKVRGCLAEGGGRVNEVAVRRRDCGTAFVLTLP